MAPEDLIKLEGWQAEPAATLVKPRKPRLPRSAGASLSEPSKAQGYAPYAPRQILALLGCEPNHIIALI